MLESIYEINWLNKKATTKLLIMTFKFREKLLL